MMLSENDRADLVAGLLESLDPVADKDVDAAWSEEIQLRLKEIKDGHVQPIPWAEARRMIMDDNDEPSSQSGDRSAGCAGVVCSQKSLGSAEVHG
jgi:putative addiction module component (TIGR02574 family)